MALIRESLAAGHLLKSDTYAYTPTLPWIDHEWGAGALAYFSTKWLGGSAIIGLKFAAALGTLLVCVRCCRERRTDFRILTLCAPLAVFLAYLGFLSTIRAQAYSFLLTAVWLLFLEFDRRGNRAWMIAALAIFPLWVNLHAGFVVALFLIALQALDSRLRRQPFRHLLPLLFAMTVEIFLNPYGAAFFTYLTRALFMPRPYSGEWDAIYRLGVPLTVAYIAALLVALYSIASIGWTRATGTLVLAATAMEAAIHRKLLPLFAIAWICYVPAYLQHTAPGRWWIAFAHRRRQFFAAAWIFLACICAFSAIRQKPWELAVPQPVYPVGPVEYLAQHKFTGNLMVPFRLGAYVSWKLYPAVKVSVDSRYEVAYPNAVVKEIFDFYAAAPSWRSTLDGLSTDAVLLPAEAPVSSAMSSTNWQCVYKDRQFEIYTRPGLALPVEDWSAKSFEGVFP